MGLSQKLYLGTNSTSEKRSPPTITGLIMLLTTTKRSPAYPYQQHSAGH